MFKNLSRRLDLLLARLPPSHNRTHMSPAELSVRAKRLHARLKAIAGASEQLDTPAARLALATQHEDEAGQILAELRLSPSSVPGSDDWLLAEMKARRARLLLTMAKQIRRDTIP
jgi:hypothetical protein